MKRMGGRLEECSDYKQGCENLKDEDVELGFCCVIMGLRGSS
ncbi:hypothetical protein Hanom_Chr17g01544011 [Helianthus anomalus]